jgi:hypothetical protein
MRNPIAAITSPIGPNHLRRRGHRVMMANVNGEARYKIPYINLAKPKWDIGNSPYANSGSNYGNVLRITAIATEFFRMARVIFLEHTES